MNRKDLVETCRLLGEESSAPKTLNQLLSDISRIINLPFTELKKTSTGFKAVSKDKQYKVSIDNIEDVTIRSVGGGPIPRAYQLYNRLRQTYYTNIAAEGDEDTEIHGRIEWWKTVHTIHGYDFKL